MHKLVIIIFPIGITLVFYVRQRQRQKFINSVIASTKPRLVSIYMQYPQRKRGAPIAGNHWSNMLAFYIIEHAKTIAGERTSEAYYARRLLKIKGGKRGMFVLNAMDIVPDLHLAVNKEIREMDTNVI